MDLFDVGIIKVTYNPTWDRVESAEVIMGDDRIEKHPATVTRDFLVQQIHAGLRVYLVRIVSSTWYAPLTRVDLLNVEGKDYLKATNDRSTIDDLG